METFFLYGRTSVRCSRWPGISGCIFDLGKKALAFFFHIVCAGFQKKRFESSEKSIHNAVKHSGRTDDLGPSYRFCIFHFWPSTHGPWILYFPKNASVSFATSQKTIEALSNKYVFLMSPRLPTIADAFFILPKMHWYKIGSRNPIALRNHVLQRYVARAAC